MNIFLKYVIYILLTCHLLMFLSFIYKSVIFIKDSFLLFTNKSLKMLEFNFTKDFISFRRCSTKEAALRKEPHRCFRVSFIKFLRTPFYTGHFWWLLLYWLKSNALFIGKINIIFSDITENVMF